MASIDSIHSCDDSCPCHKGGKPMPDFIDWTQLPGPCPVCEGEGQVLRNASIWTSESVDVVPCRRCDGRGEVVR